MTQVEDVAGASTGALKYATGLRANAIRRGKERDRVEVSHDGDIFPQTLPAFREINAPVQTDTIAPGLAHQFEQRRRAGAEMYDGRAGCDSAYDALRMRHHIFTVIVRAQTTDP